MPICPFAYFSFSVAIYLYVILTAASYSVRMFMSVCTKKHRILRRDDIYSGTVLLTLRRKLLWWLVAGFSPRGPGFNPRPFYIRFVVNKVTLGQVLPQVRWFSHVSIIFTIAHYSHKYVIHLPLTPYDHRQ